MTRNVSTTRQLSKLIKHHWRWIMRTVIGSKLSSTFALLARIDRSTDTPSWFAVIYCISKKDTSNSDKFPVLTADEVVTPWYFGPASCMHIETIQALQRKQLSWTMNPGIYHPLSWRTVTVCKGWLIRLLQTSSLLVNWIRVLMLSTGPKYRPHYPVLGCKFFYNTGQKPELLKQ